MEYIASYYGYLNLVIGALMLSIGFKIYSPFKNEKADEHHKKYGLIYKLGGLAFVIWGLFKVL